MSNEKKNEKPEVKEPEVKEPEVKEPEVEAYDPNELVDYMAPLMPGTKQRDIFGAVNGETFCVKRGVPVKIKRKFLSALQNADAQQIAAYRAMVQIQSQGSKPSANM